MSRKNKNKSKNRGNSKFKKNNQVDQDNEFALAAYETDSVNVNQANKFTSQIQVDALKAGAGASQSLKFTTIHQVNALKLGARPAEALILITQNHIDLYKTGFYTISEIKRIESERVEKKAEKLREKNVFESNLQKEAFETGKLTPSEALKVTSAIQVEALKYPSVRSLEEAQLITKPVQLDALRVKSTATPEVVKDTRSYLAISLMAQNDYSEEELVHVAHVKNFYSFKLLNAVLSNVTAEEALNINNWFKYHAFISGRVNATAAAEFNGPRYQLLKTSDLSVDDILRFNSFNQIKAFNTEKVSVDEALAVQNFCQVLVLKSIQEPDLEAMKLLSSECNMEIHNNICKVIDLENENLVIEGECTPEYLL